MQPKQTMQSVLARASAKDRLVLGAARAVATVAALSLAFASAPSAAWQAQQPAPARQAAAAQEPTTTQDTQPQDSASEPIAEVVVSGEQPGPGRWKVSRGTHVL